MLTKMKLALAVALISLAGGAALANGHGGQARPGKATIMKQFDANHDGTLDAAERAKLKDARQARATAMKAKHLTRFDANKNGQLDPGERDTMKSERQLAHFKKLDANSDGTITLDEFKAGKQARRGPRGHGARGHRP